MFLTLPGFEAQAIPTPVAPARPITMPVGPTIPVTTNMGVQGQLDSAGNIWDEAGAYIGKAGSTTPSKPAASSSGSALSTLEKWAAGLVSLDANKSTGLSLEDIIFIVLGLLLIAGALFTFKETKTTIQNVTKNVRGAADAKLAELLAA